MTDMEMRLRGIKDYEGRKSEMVVTCQSGKSHSTIPTAKEQEQSDGSCYRICFLEGNETNKIREGPV